MKRKLVLCSLLAAALVSLGFSCREKTEYVYMDAGGHVTAQGAEWDGSGHSDKTSEAFRHWDEDGLVSTSCAKCHSKYGFLDFIGEDGSAVGTVDVAAATDSVIDCGTCHNESAQALTSVEFPSGEIVSDLGSEAICMQCHQGRQSTVSVDSHIADASPLANDDTASTDLSFRNVHYYAAGATLYGAVVHGGYEYATIEGYAEAPVYEGKFAHAAEYESCTDCHNPHSLEVKVDTCSACHVGANTLTEVRDIRMIASTADYDGDGDTTEGVKGEIETLMATLLDAIYDYATEVAGTAIVFNPAHHPYWFVDDDGDGVADEDEETDYEAFTARLIRATYNYQFAKKDPGAYAHNAKYVIQLLYDSIADLATQVTVTGTRVRGDSGHFDVTSHAWVYSRFYPSLRSSCARCHGAAGFEYYLTQGQDPAINLDNPSPSLTCDTCHVGGDYASGAATKYVATVTFPSGVEIDNTPSTPDDSFICMTCHQGRESKADVDEAIAAAEYEFLNVHYAPAGAVLFGADAKVGYEYTGPSYEGKFTHEGGETAQCTYCHGGDDVDHHFPVKFTSTCTPCHTEVTTGALSEIRKDRDTDYDGDADNTEPLADEVEAIADALYAEIIDYSINTVGTQIVYNADAHPYWFVDANDDGIPDPDPDPEEEYLEYADWDPTLMKACFNYQFYLKEHGAWAHNTLYIIQLLYDSIDDVGGAGTAAGLGFNRP